MVRALVALVLTTLGASCSYAPAFGDCEVTCNAPDQCPSGFTCNQEGRCRAPATSGNCNDVLGDARRDSSDPDDDAPPNANCTGSVTACQDLTNSSTCGAQNGCGWSSPTCTVTTNCAMYTTNQACTNAPECMTDFTTSTCVKDPSFCNGTTEPQCETSAKCLFTNGCSGAAATCDVFTEEVACDEQFGCSWD